MPVVLRNGHLDRRLGIVGKPPGVDLSRVLDLELRPVALPETGLALSERVAQHPGRAPGDLVEVELMDDSRRRIDVPVTEVIQSYLGLMAFMDIDALARLSGTGPRISGAILRSTQARLDDLYAAVKETPVVSDVTLQTASRDKFQQTMQENILIMITVYFTLAVIIAFGVVYNCARIQLSERARELATLRVLGFGAQRGVEGPVHRDRRDHRRGAAARLAARQARHRRFVGTSRATCSAYRSSSRLAHSPSPAWSWWAPRPSRRSSCAAGSTASTWSKC